MSENILQTEDKYSAVSFGFAPNRWHVTTTKILVLSVNDEYNYSKLLELYNAIEVDKREAIAWAVIDKKNLFYRTVNLLKLSRILPIRLLVFEQLHKKLILHLTFFLWATAELISHR